MKDLNDWADYCGIVLRRPEDWPADSNLAGQGALLALDADRGMAYSTCVFQAYFERGEDLTDIATLRRAAEAAGLSGDPFEHALPNAALEERLRHNCRELLDRGGFGSPTLFVADAMFFGHDRMPLVEFALGQSSGRQFVAPGDHKAGSI
ncbi:MAG: hypothetical protein GWM87_06045 [Xanthomonadales bacterium]|nr:hypothetical protein [Xanthomonadales bacterium]NIX12536.1 hypothetical protein [Xanthomonadales bacterium]